LAFSERGRCAVLLETMLLAVLGARLRAAAGDLRQLHRLDLGANFTRWCSRSGLAPLL